MDWHNGRQREPGIEIFEEEGKREGVGERSGDVHLRAGNPLWEIVWHSFFLFFFSFFFNHIWKCQLLCFKAITCWAVWWKGQIRQLMSVYLTTSTDVRDCRGGRTATVWLFPENNETLLPSPLKSQLLTSGFILKPSSRIRMNEKNWIARLNTKNPGLFPIISSNIHI